MPSWIQNDDGRSPGIEDSLVLRGLVEDSVLGGAIEDEEERVEYEFEG